MINSIAAWQEFQDKLDAYCKETYQSFVKDDSKTVESVNKHRKELFPAELQFAFVRMSCVHYTGRNANRNLKGSLQAKDGGFVAATPVTITHIYKQIRF